MIVGDRLEGLGACDMKGSLAVMLELALRREPRSNEVTWVFYAREEITRTESGLLEIGELRPDLLQADAAVLGEPTGGIVEAGCQGSLRVSIELRGFRAHPARPFTGINAIHRLGALLTRVASYEPRVVIIDGVIFTEQLQAVSVEGGVAPNVVPDLARCTLNHRVAPDRNKEEAVASIIHFLGECLHDEDTFSVGDWAPSSLPNLGNVHLEELVKITNAEPRGKVGWTDVATFAELGIPATNFGVGDPLLAHRSDEFITLSELDEYARALELWLR
jgi:succinyl-diaminopimelate desuccinylase